MACVAANCVANTLQAPSPRKEIQKVFEYKSEDAAFDHIIFSPNNRYFLTYNRHGPAYVWRTEDYFLVNKIKLKDENTSNIITGVCFMPDSNRLFVGKREGQAIITDFYSKETATYEVSKNASYTSATSHSGHLLALGSELFDMRRDKHLGFHLILQSGPLFTNDDKHCVFSDVFEGAIVVMDTKTGTQRRVWKESGFFTNPRACGIDVSADNDTVAAGFDNGKIILYSIRSGDRTDTFRHGRKSRPYVIFSSDGRHLVSWSRHERNAILWDVAKAAKIGQWKFQNTPVCLKLFPNDKLMAIGTDAGELIVEPLSGKPTIANEKILEKQVTDIAISSSGKLILVCNEFGDILALEFR